ncbi:MAG: hypothetical protein ACOVQ2_02320 [Flavobacterium sp.]
MISLLFPTIISEAFEVQNIDNFKSLLVIELLENIKFLRCLV